MARAMKQTRESTIYRGNLEICTQADAEKYKHLTEVSGDLYINSSAELDALTSVGGYLYINSSAELDAHALTSVGGYLYINKKDALTASKLYTGGYDKFTVLDNIPCVILSEKKQGDVSVLMCRRAQIKKQKVVGDKFYVARSGEYNAHGKTIAEAVQDLQFKMGVLDVEQYRDLPRNTKKTPAEWAIVYRIVTGACRFGTEDFMNRKGKLKKSYTLAEIINETKGAWGHDAFVRVVAP